MPIEVRETCKFCGNEVIAEKMGRIACKVCFPNIDDKVDFRLQEEKNAYYKEQARKGRLQRLPRDMVCPRCEKPKLDTRSWVIRADGLVICRSCNYELNFLKGRGMESKFDKSFTAIHCTRYTINGAALREARISIGISMRGLAKECKWGTTYQNELECGDVLSISDMAYERLVAAFEKMKKIPDYDVEIAALREKQKQAKLEYGKRMFKAGTDRRGLIKKP